MSTHHVWCSCALIPSIPYLSVYRWCYVIKQIDSIVIGYDGFIFRGVKDAAMMMYANKAEVVDATYYPGRTTNEALEVFAIVSSSVKTTPNVLEKITISLLS